MFSNRFSSGVNLSKALSINTGLYTCRCLLTHMALAVTTIGLGAYNLYMGLHRLRYGSVGAMAAGMTTHRRMGHMLVWTFTGTMVTAYVVYLMLFVWFKG